MAEPPKPASFLRLSGIQTSQLPPPSASADELRVFVTSLLEEAVPFIDSAAPRSADYDSSAARAGNPLWKTKGTKKFAESDAKVELSERVVTLDAASSTDEATSNGGQLRGGEEEQEQEQEQEANGTDGANGTNGKQQHSKKKKEARANKAGHDKPETETWACRRSVHRDAAQKGTASWAEFVAAIRDDHAATEDAFTPTVLGHRLVATWAGAASLATSTDGTGSGSGSGQGRPVEVGGIHWGGFSMHLVEMKHKVPPPLKPRVFPVVQVICTAVAGGRDGRSGVVARRPRDEFLVVSVPVAGFASGAGAGAGAGAGPAPPPTQQDLAPVLSVEKGVVVGAYASVERVRRLPSQGPEAGGGEQGRIEWLMATASDARGVLPMWVQTRAVPGQIAKDVSLFLGWMNTERRKTNEGNKKEGEGEGEVEVKEEEAEAAGKKGDVVTGQGGQGGNGQVAAAS